MTYGFRMIDSRVRIGAAGPRGLWIPQVDEMQPVGHWVTNWKSILPVRRKPSLFARWRGSKKGWIWVEYPKERKELPWV